MNLQTSAEKAQQLEKALSVLTKLGVVDVKLEFTPNGLHAAAMDVGNVAYVNLHYKTKNMTTYECVEDEANWLSLKDFKTALQKSRKGIVTIATTKDTITIINTDGAKSKTTTLRFIEPIGEAKKAPNITYDEKTTLATNDLSTAIGDVTVEGESVTLMSEEEALRVETKTATKQTASSLPAPGLKLKKRATYNPEYLSIAAMNITENCTLEYAADFPARITQDDDDVTLYIIIAPRVSSE